MESYRLNIVGHSADLKTSPTGSKDTGIFFPQELIDFIGRDDNLSFIVHKEDCAQAMAAIINSLPLYSNKGGKKITHDSILDECSFYLLMINNFFRGNETAVYSGFTLSETTSSRRYLYGLEQKGFSVRKFLVAEHSYIDFIKDSDGSIHLRFKTNLTQGVSSVQPQNESHNILETPIANYITQYDDMLFEAGKKEDILQKKCDQYYKDKTFPSTTLACSIFGILFAPHLEKLNIKPTGTTNFNAIGEGKNIGLFLRKFIQKGACPTLSPEDLELMKQYIDIFTNALKTKPFLLLAGISGTGKSQKVKELAYASCPNDKELRSDETKPGNYCLIEVKPNWHDSTELLGYWSNLSQKYMLTDFIRFAYKATKYPNVPFFLCLDEMNLAPVEQYFAEYLSVLESRKVVAGKIVTEPLITKDIFKNCNLTKDGQYAYTAEDASIIEELQKDGLRLPDNLFVIGTVNMDDTTHQFSRKVIDRAFTIEMNGGKLEDMFNDENKMKLEYRQDGQEAKLELFKSNYTKATEAIDSEKVKPFAEVIKTEVPKLLNAVNDILAKTPFRVSYRVQNEMVLYICNAIENATEDIDINAVIGTAFLATLLEKILPRVQGDERLLKTAEGNVFTDLKKYVEQMQNAENTAEGETNFKALVVSKLDEMNDRLAKSYFASFFG